MSGSNRKAWSVVLALLSMAIHIGAKETGRKYWKLAKPLIKQGKSAVYPHSLILRKHANSVSVNTKPPFSGTTSELIGNTGLDNKVRRVARPAYADPDTYRKKIYFDSKARGPGRGVKHSPYNSLEGLTTGKLLASDTAYLIRAGSVFMLSGIRQDYKKPRTRMYFGSYGEGDMPIICNADKFENPTRTDGGFWFFGDKIAVNGLHLVSCCGRSYSTILGLSGSYITIANCHIEGMMDSNGRYPHYGIKGGANHFTMYNTEFSYARSDLFYLSTRCRNYEFVSNYFHHCNVGTFEDARDKGGNITKRCDPKNRSTWNYKKGDIIQFESGTPVSSYFANNVFDRGDSASKFCFIINGNTPLAKTQGTSIEYNTFISPLKTRMGGAGCYIYSHVLFKNNLFINTDPEGRISALATHKNYGANFTNSHFVNYGGAEMWNAKLGDLGEGTKTFKDLSTYRREVELQDRKGSSLF